MIRRAPPPDSPISIDASDWTLAPPVSRLSGASACSASYGSIDHVLTTFPSPVERRRGEGRECVLTSCDPPVRFDIVEPSGVPGIHHFKAEHFVAENDVDEIAATFRKGVRTGVAGEGEQTSSPP